MHVATLRLVFETCAFDIAIDVPRERVAKTDEIAVAAVHAKTVTCRPA